jgi:hypothetical protein
MIGVLMATAVVRNLLRSKVSLVTVFVELKQRGRVATSPDLPILEEVRQGGLCLSDEWGGDAFTLLVRCRKMMLQRSHGSDETAEIVISVQKKSRYKFFRILPSQAKLIIGKLPY